MPELVPLWEELVQLAGGDEQVARMLSLVDPAPYLAGCSQAVWLNGRARLVRNYDFRPDACEGMFLLTRWHETRVLAASDCLWGALDGVNEHGLCVALSFGGSRSVGPGFGIPIILRYVLEFCSTVDEASAVLRRIPSHMAYNVSLLDAKGDHAVAMLGPDRPPEIRPDRVCTNHQGSTEWSDYAQLTRSAERMAFLEKELVRRQGAERFSQRFLEPPLYMTDHRRGYGTLYTVSYSPDGCSAEFLWPEHRIHQSIDDFAATDLTVSYG